MIFSNRDYFASTKPIEEKIRLQAQDFIKENEEIICTFDSTDIVAFFTNKKIIFASNIKSKFFETEILPYTSISRCNVIGSSDIKYGKLDIAVSDEIILSFLLPEYKDAVELCNKILLYI